MPDLSNALFREVRPDFFRVLTGPLARLYVDALDALEREAGQRNQGIDRAEALAVVEQVVDEAWIQVWFKDVARRSGRWEKCE